MIWNPGIWLAIIIHDWGYWGRCSMDGIEYNGGAWHPSLALLIFENFYANKTAKFCFYHSRFMVKLNNGTVSRLGVADKLAIVYTPTWMYCREEMDEYIHNEKNVIINSFVGRKDRIKAWKQVVDDKCLAFVEEWKDKAYDLWQYKV